MRISVRRSVAAFESNSRRQSLTWRVLSQPRSRAFCQTRDSKVVSMRSNLNYAGERLNLTPNRRDLLVAEVEGFVDRLGGGAGGNAQRRAALVALDRGAGAEHHHVVLGVALGTV